MISQMFKRLNLLLIGIIGLSLFISVNIWAAKSDEEKAAEEAQKKREMIEAIKKRLDYTDWEIELGEMGNGSKKKIRDIVHFKDGKVEAETLVAEGFMPTNYTLTLKKDNIVVWETMQSSEKAGLAFWRGEIEGSRMRGVLSRHFSEKKVIDYSFVTVGGGKEIIPGKETAYGEVPQEAAPAEVTEKKPAAEETLKTEAIEVKKGEPIVKKEETKKEEKKKGWWER